MYMSRWQMEYNSSSVNVTLYTLSRAWITIMLWGKAFPQNSKVMNFNIHDIYLQCNPKTRKYMEYNSLIVISFDNNVILRVIMIIKYMFRRFFSHEKKKKIPACKIPVKFIFYNTYWKHGKATNSDFCCYALM